MRATSTTPSPRTRRARTRSRKNIWKTATRFAAHRRSREQGRGVDDNREDASTLPGSASAGSKKMFAAGAGFRDATPDLREIRCRDIRRRSALAVARREARDVSRASTDAGCGNETGRLRGRIGLLREATRWRQ
jgi:hypothetical protein